MLSFDDIQLIHEKLESLPAPEIVAWAARQFGEGLALASSFGPEDMVLLDLLLKSDPGARVFMLDTGRLHQETYDLVEATRKRYNRDFEILVPRTESLEALLKQQGPNGFYASVEARHACCHARKVEPLARALTMAQAWITGQRRSQSITRAHLRFAERDMEHGGIVKLNPLAAWSETEVWDYIREHDLPVNALHAKGFPSIGCAPCTRAVAPGEDIRSGRWWWEQPEHRECGLHKNV
jgi:phosphoadenosine phosphosulfate reductase